MIDKKIADTIGIPDYYVDEYNATTMINFWPIMSEFANVFSPAAICEIGSERGLTSSRLAKLLPRVQIHVVDPVISEAVKGMSNVVAHEETSLTFMSKKLEIPFYIIDGDHNYETVSAEIKAAVKNSGSGPFCAMFHDVGWPFARRDGYYNPEQVSTPHDYSFNSVLKLETGELEPGSGGFESGDYFALSKHSGGEKNGVLTAIEDFHRTAGDKWKLITFPMFYGMAILWNEDGLDKESVLKIKNMQDSIEILSPIFSCAEANRLRLLQGLAETRDDLLKERKMSAHLRDHPYRNLLRFIGQWRANQNS